MQLGTRLTKLRNELGFNQKELAEKLNVDPSKYNKWENGKNYPSYETICKLADFHKTTIDYLFGRTNNPMSNSYRQVKFYYLKLNGLTHKLNHVNEIKELIDKTVSSFSFEENKPLKIEILCDYKYEKVKEN